MHGITQQRTFVTRYTETVFVMRLKHCIHDQVFLDKFNMLMCTIQIGKFSLRSRLLQKLTLRAFLQGSSSRKTNQGKHGPVYRSSFSSFYTILSNTLVSHKDAPKTQTLQDDKTSCQFNTHIIYPSCYCCFITGTSVTKIKLLICVTLLKCIGVSRGFAVFGVVNTWCTS